MFDDTQTDRQTSITYCKLRWLQSAVDVKHSLRGATGGVFLASNASNHFWPLWELTTPAYPQSDGEGIWEIPPTHFLLHLSHLFNSLFSEHLLQSQIYTIAAQLTNKPLVDV